ncbi:MAG: heme ABC exporter ATP-binding protein CcmA [Armatimonadota bacterium]|nr:heme ABC exporter ATP-binding protein CcmA [Armatimonadota bacterium]MDR7445128.1 heme ABC exporter ATP-binding protein CcmA [Armatimonadota bacterium]MDR7569775.1 heme ABC exporter ATP-binding protein CcmA [Armatimonadota bacterium]MDR7614028.1 heme ABC exporter ATP-binding protein CcmA [Armatimonadota bacterium]
MSPVLSARGIRKALGEHRVLREVDLEVYPGEAVAIVGPNGSGKTTLLRVLATLLRPDRGSLRLFGLDPWHEPQAVRIRLGMTGHETFLYGGLTVEENLRLFAVLYGVAPERVEGLIQEGGLGARRGELVRNLSRGWQQRVSLVRALLPQPALLLLDEPFTGLDAEGSDWLRTTLLRYLASGGALVLTTHRPQEVAGLCHRILGLRDGRLVPEAGSSRPPATAALPGGGRVPGFWTAYRALVSKDLRIELRAREILLSMGTMALVALVLFSVAVGLDPAVVASAGPGILWTTVTFTALLGLGRAYELEQEQRAGWAVLASPVDRAAILGAKATSTFLWMLLVEALSLGVFAVLLNVDLDPRRVASLGAVLLLGSAGLGLPGTLLSVVAANTRLRQLMLPLLLVPLALPLLIGSVGATAKVLRGLPLGEAWPELRLVAAFAIILGAASLLLFEAVVEDGS